MGPRSSSCRVRVKGTIAADVPLGPLKNDAGETMATDPRQTASSPHAGTETTTDAARQGVTSGRVITVLLVSLALAILGMVIGYFLIR